MPSYYTCAPQAYSSTRIHRKEMDSGWTEYETRALLQAWEEESAQKTCKRKLMKLSVKIFQSLAL